MSAEHHNHHADPFLKRAPYVGPPARVIPADAHPRKKGCVDLCWPLFFLANVGVTLWIVLGMAMNVAHSTAQGLSAADAAKLGQPANAAASLAALLCLAVLIAHITVLFFLGLQTAGPSWALGLVLAVACKLLLGTGCALLVTGHLYTGAALLLLFGWLVAYVCRRWVSLRLTSDLGIVVKRSMQASPGLVPAVGLVVLFPGLLLVTATAVVLTDFFVCSRLPERFLHHHLSPVNALYLFFMLYWGVGVLGNMVYALSAGCVERWYYGEREKACGRALRQVLWRSSGAICLSAFLRGPLHIARGLGWLGALCQHGRHDLGNAMAARLLTQCCGGCMRSRRSESLMFLGRECLSFVMLRGEDLCTAAHLMAGHRYSSGFQDIADSNLNHHLSGCVAMLYNGFVAGLVTYGLLELSWSVDVLVQEADSMGGGKEMAAGWLRLLLLPWSARFFVSFLAFLAAALLTNIAGFLEGGSAGLVAAWSEDAGVLEQSSPHLHEKLRAHVVKYGGEARMDPGRDPIYSSDDEKRKKAISWSGRGSETFSQRSSRRGDSDSSAGVE